MFAQMHGSEFICVIFLHYERLVALIAPGYSVRYCVGLNKIYN